MFRMIEDEKYHITTPEFVSLFRLGDADIDYSNLHDSGLLETNEMHFMYPNNMRREWGKWRVSTHTMRVLNRLFKKTLTPRDGNPSDVTHFQRNLMAAMRLGTPQFSVGDFIWQEIKNLSENPQKICSYNPYIMFMIRKRTGTSSPRDVSHNPLRPHVSKTIRILSPPSCRTWRGRNWGWGAALAVVSCCPGRGRFDRFP